MNTVTTGIELQKRIFEVSPEDFEPLALEVYAYQYEFNEVYRQFCDLLKRGPAHIRSITEIPFLPIELFKSREIKTTDFLHCQVFESSGTTGAKTSSHYIKDIAVYEESFLRSFQLFYGDIKDYCILGLLPSYLERSGSSLVWMTDALIKRSAYMQSGFFLYDQNKLYETLLSNEANGIKTLLIGVTYALLDFADSYPMQLHHTIVMETGGMKGRKKELTRREVHTILKQRLGLHVIHSEYGMTELFSQAYARKNGLFESPPWMKVLVRAEDDPFSIKGADESSRPVAGAGNIIDLANIYSCSFIATDDLLILHPGDVFEVLGRLDNSDVRGCGLMVV